mmetsp:Transcript_9082/g.11730  ORF Transcript_9082/g.11730 Transcript_9082/m.11730 type:complete len:81 (+) Transcript_9082:577-819(+)
MTEWDMAAVDTAMTGWDTVTVDMAMTEWDMVEVEVDMAMIEWGMEDVVDILCPIVRAIINRISCALGLSTFRSIQDSGNH